MLLLLAGLWADDRGAAAATLYVVRRGWHIDIGFAAAELSPSLVLVAGQFPGVSYLLFGFGDRRYLIAGRHDAPDLLRALWPGPGLLLVTALATSPEIAFGKDHVITLQVTDEQFARAQAFVRTSLTPRQQRALEGFEDDGFPIALPGPYEGSLFLDTTFRYSAANTCNTWVAHDLADAGLPIRSSAVVFAGQLWRQVKNLSPPPLSAAP